MKSVDKPLVLAEITFREDSHYNAKDWFGYGWTCVQEPRITMIRRYQRKTRSHTDEWRVDGEPVASAEAAVKKVNRK